MMLNFSAFFESTAEHLLEESEARLQESHLSLCKYLGVNPDSEEQTLESTL